MTPGKSVVLWRTRLEPFTYAVTSFWTALSLQSSPTVTFGTYAGVFIVLLGSTLLDGSSVHQIGLFLLLSALYYALLIAGVRYHSVTDHGARNRGVVMEAVCLHLAQFECLLLALVANIGRVRRDQPVTFYLSGIMAVYFLGRLGHWLTFNSLLWISVITLLTLLTALSRCWVSVPTPEKVTQTLHSTVTAIRTAIGL